MTAHPIDTVIVDGVPVAKADLRDYSKMYERLRFGDPDEVRNTNLTGQFGGIYIYSLQALFDLNSADTTTPDNGIDTIWDSEGNRFKRVVFSTVLAQLEITDAGDVTLADDNTDDILLINKVADEQTIIYLPDAAIRTKSIRVVDKKGNASSYPITIRPKAASGQTIMGASEYVIDFSGGSLILSPYADGSGYF